MRATSVIEQSVTFLTGGEAACARADGFMKDHHTECTNDSCCFGLLRRHVEVGNHENLRPATVSEAHHILDQFKVSVRDGDTVLKTSCYKLESYTPESDQVPHHQVTGRRPCMWA